MKGAIDPAHVASAPTLRIRIADRADAEGIARLHAASWRSAYRGALSDAYLDGPIDAERLEVWSGRLASPRHNQHIVVAESLGELVGFACTYGGEDAQWGSFLDNLHVVPERKRQGTGARLMADAAAWSLEHYPHRGLYLWVLESNEAARRFYERVGGEYAGRELWHPPDGTALPKLRIVWHDPHVLLERECAR